MLETEKDSNDSSHRSNGPEETSSPTRLPVNPRSSKYQTGSESKNMQNQQKLQTQKQQNKLQHNGQYGQKERDSSPKTDIGGEEEMFGLRIPLPSNQCEAEKSYINPSPHRITGSNMSVDRIKEIMQARSYSEQKLHPQNFKEIDFTNPQNRQEFEDIYFGSSPSPTPNNNINKLNGNDLHNNPNINLPTSQSRAYPSEQLQGSQDQNGEKYLQKKYRVLAFALAVIGIILIIVGFIFAFSSDVNFLGGGAFWVLGLLCSVPGCYYSFKILQHTFAKKNPIGNANNNHVSNDDPNVASSLPPI